MAYAAAAAADDDDDCMVVMSINELRYHRRMSAISLPHVWLSVYFTRPRSED